MNGFLKEIEKIEKENPGNGLSALNSINDLLKNISYEFELIVIKNNKEKGTFKEIDNFKEIVDSLTDLYAKYKVPGLDEFTDKLIKLYIPENNIL